MKTALVCALVIVAFSLESSAARADEECRAGWVIVNGRLTCAEEASMYVPPDSTAPQRTVKPPKVVQKAALYWANPFMESVWVRLASLLGFERG